jgi:hypothetical protein
MRSSADRRAAFGTWLPACGLAGLLVLAAGCSRDLTIPPPPTPPPPVSVVVRMTVQVQRNAASDVTVSAERTLDETGAPATGSIAQDQKPVEASLWQSRMAEFQFPLSGSNQFIQPGTWVFTVRIRSREDPEDPKTATCQASLTLGGVNNLGVVEPSVDPTSADPMLCHGDFVVFKGDHDAGVDSVTVAPQSVRVGTQPSIEVVVGNFGRNTESFGLEIRTRRLLPTESPVPCEANKTCWSRQVQALPSATLRLLPGTGDPAIAWDTSRLAPGRYVVEAEITPPVAQDVDPDNNVRRSAPLELTAGDQDGDGDLDDQDNCPLVANPGQENCDMRPAGDACDIPRLRTVNPDCQIGPGELVSVTGFGFASVQPDDITIGAETADTVVTRSACLLEFRNKTTNPSPSGSIRIRIPNGPTLERPLCCPSTGRIDDFEPIQAAPGATVTVLGCGLSGVRIRLEPAPGSVAMAPPEFPSQPTSTPNRVTFVVPMATTRNADYFIRLVRLPDVDLRTSQPLAVR